MVVSRNRMETTDMHMQEGKVMLSCPLFDGDRISYRTTRQVYRIT